MPLALVASEPRHAHRGAQFEKPRFLHSGRLKSGFETLLGDFCTTCPSIKLPSYSGDFWRKPHVGTLIHRFGEEALILLPYRLQSNAPRRLARAGRSNETVSRLRATHSLLLATSRCRFHYPPA